VIPATLAPQFGPRIPDGECFHEIVARMAIASPNAPAISLPGRDISYAELECRSKQIAMALRSAAPPGTLIGILAASPSEVVACVLGTLKAGQAFMALDPETPERRLTMMCTAARPAAFLASSRFAASLASVTDGLPVIEIDRLPAEPAADDPSLPKNPAEMAYIYFTSGSTGLPKPIAGTLAAATHFIQWEIDLISAGPGTRVSQITPPGFDGFLKDVFVPLCSGGTVCIPEDRTVIFESNAFVRWLEEQAVTVLHCVPSLFRVLLASGLDTNALPRLKYVVLAGERVVPRDAKAWFDGFGDRARLFNFYGPTETTIIKSFHEIRPADAIAPSIPIGQPIPGAELLVLDGAGLECPPGIVGEIHIRTPHRSLGYYNRPDLTAACFVPNPMTGDAKDIVYRTGDLGRRRVDGLLEYIGRRDQQVKIRGVRIELGEIETLLRQHEAVREAVVVDRDDSSGNKYLCAYLVLTSDANLQAVQDHVDSFLPEMMRPAAYICLDELPRTSNGKVNRAALPSMEASRRVEPYCAPRTGVERDLVVIWENLLGVSQIGVHDNFFQLGGHSLRVTQVISRIRGQFGVEVHLQNFFEHPTVAGLGQHVESLIVAAAPEERLQRLLSDRTAVQQTIVPA